MLHGPLGHGKSPKSRNSDDYNVQSQINLVASQNYGKILLGYSMGARLALHSVLAFPDIWKGLIMISGTAGLRKGQEERVHWDLSLVNRLCTNSNSEFWRYWSTVPIIQSQSKIEEEFRINREKRRMEMDLHSLAASVLGFGAGVMPSVWHRISEVCIPVLLIAGQEDKKYKKLAADLDSAFLHSKLEIISKSGHAPHMEKPTIVGHIIDKWINSLAL